MFETKCRRCGTFHERPFAEKKYVKWDDFVIAIKEWIEHPRSYHCNNCYKETVQDIVSYSLS